MEKPYNLTYLSLGGGVQSTALLAMSALGLQGCPRADVAIFADTKAEVSDTYLHLDILREWSMRHGIPVETVSAGSLDRHVRGEEEARDSGYIVSIPAFSSEDQRGGLLRRQCTAHYKLDPLRRRVREMLGLKPRQKAAGKVKVRALIGISLDEVYRMKASKEKWIDNAYPLVDARMRRLDCLNLLAELKLPQPVRSACYFCPYHDNHYWRWLKTERPEYFQQACEVDALIRNQTAAGVTNPAYLHRQRRPLAEIDLRDSPGQQLLWDSFAGECEGMCGV